MPSSLSNSIRLGWDDRPILHEPDDPRGPFWSLWDIMQNVWCDQYISVGSLLEHQAELCRSKGAVSIRDSDRTHMAANVWLVERLCTYLSLTQSHLLAFDLMTMLEHSSHPNTFLEVAVLLDSVKKSITNEAAARLYFAVPQALSKYVHRERPLGDDVYKAFPSSHTDLTQAGNCLAYGCNTAAAFHLMRAVEIGLWELGRDRQIALAKSGKIEFSEWGTIIKELEDAIKAIQQWPNSKKKEDAHKFYNTALMEVRGFNDGWRRHTAHVRLHQPTMQDDEALALWGHVARFLSALAAKISEGSYTPLVW